MPDSWEDQYANNQQQNNAYQGYEDNPDLNAQASSWTPYQQAQRSQQPQHPGNRPEFQYPQGQNQPPFNQFAQQQQQQQQQQYGNQMQMPQQGYQNMQNAQHYQQMQYFQQQQMRQQGYHQGQGQAAQVQQPRQTKIGASKIPPMPPKIKSITRKVGGIKLSSKPIGKAATSKVTSLQEPATTEDEEVVLTPETNDAELDHTPEVAGSSAVEEVKKEVEETPPKKEVQAEKEDVKEEEEEEEQEQEQIELPPADPREHLNIVFIGHVDAGKSTLSGSILYSMGTVDDRTIEKYKKEAKETNRESWFLAFIMDTNEEERARGKTVEVGRATFCTEKKRYTMLDAPGHKNYVPAMIAGAAQADVGILVISARKGEFEAGFDRLGQTREHATLAKTLGVQKLVVVVNKMDEVTVKWNKSRYDHCVNKLTPFLKQCGFKVKKHVIFLPISAMTGDNVKRPVPPETCKWATELNNNKSLIQILDDIHLLGRDETAPLRIPVLDKYSDRGLTIMGKIEAGYVLKDHKVLISPTNTKCTVDAIYAHVSVERKEGDGGEDESLNDQLEQREVSVARVGENVTIKLKDATEDDIVKGFVISDRIRPLKPCRTFVCQLQLLELLPHRALFTAGYNCVLHVHTAIEECTVLKLLKEMDMKTGKPKMEIIGGTKEKPRFSSPRFVKSGTVVWCRIKVDNLICVEPFKDMMPLGRFTLRDEGKTIAIGKVIKVDPIKEG